MQSMHKVDELPHHHDSELGIAMRPVLGVLVMIPVEHEAAFVDQVLRYRDYRYPLAIQCFEGQFTVLLVDPPDQVGSRASDLDI